MQVDNRLLDDLVRMASGAAGALSGVRGEFEARLKQHFERILAEMDIVPREEFDAVKAMAAKARTEQEALDERVAALESALAGRTPAEKKAPAAKQAPPAAGTAKRKRQGKSAG